MSRKIIYLLLGLDVRDEGVLSVRADAVRTREVLENLLSNAAKYAAAAGTVEVEASCEGDWAVLRVKDRGPGLTPEQIKYVFDEYLRAEFYRLSRCFSLLYFICYFCCCF